MLTFVPLSPTHFIPDDNIPIFSTSESQVTSDEIISAIKELEDKKTPDLSNFLTM